ncbi:MAG: hypothetical protein LBK44_03685 [Spirochaetales bacterium]|nr:hypothetical protein [Spirochaetales bacterium]
METAIFSCAITSNRMFFEVPTDFRLRKSVGRPRPVFSWFRLPPPRF